MRLLAACSTTAAAMVVLLVACTAGSGTATLPDGSEGGSDGATTPEGSTGGDSAPNQSLCPAQIPAASSPCTSAGITCEIGGTGPRLLCSTTFTCNGMAPNLNWFVSPPGAGCVADQAHNPGACPATFGGLANGVACPAGLTGRCVYDEGLCGCTPCSGDSGVSGTAEQFSCKPYPKPQGCPDPRPPIGSPCTTENQTCDYGGLCSVLGSVPSLTCNNGHWSRQNIAASCLQNTCGTVN